MPATARIKTSHPEMPPIECADSSSASTATCARTSLHADTILRPATNPVAHKDDINVHKDLVESPEEIRSNDKVQIAKDPEHGKSTAGWEFLVMFLTVTPMAGYMVIQPYQQTRRADLGCGPMCVGTMTSVSSFLGLIGAPLVGALSDHQGRRCALAIGCIAGAVSFIMLATSDSLLGLWLALIPPALLAHNFTITKAVVADLATPSQRAAVLGKLGLAAGMGFMVGPFIHPFISSYIQAAVIATILQLISLVAVHYLPSREISVATSGGATTKHGSVSIVSSVFRAVGQAVYEVGNLAIAAPAAAKVMLFLRFGLSMGFHVFYTVMSVILNERFKYGPTEYSNYFAFVGLVYSLSQLFSKNLIHRWSSDPTSLVMLCIFFLMLGRLITALTASPYVLYLALTLSIAALGVLNNTINTAVAQISGRESVGGLMGVLDTAEKLAGVCGPTVGGVLYAYDALAPVAAVTGGYLAMMAVVYVAYPRYVVPAVAHALVLPTPAAPAPPADKKNE